MHMNFDERLSVLIDRSYLFRGLAEGARAEVKAAASRALFSAGEVMIGEGEPGRDLLLIESGEVEVSTVMAGGEIQLAELGPGAVVGEVAALTAAKRTSTVREQIENPRFEEREKRCVGVYALGPTQPERVTGLSHSISRCRRMRGKRPRSVLSS